MATLNGRMLLYAAVAELGYLFKCGLAVLKFCLSMLRPPTADAKMPKKVVLSGCEGCNSTSTVSGHLGQSNAHAALTTAEEALPKTEV